MFSIEELIRIALLMSCWGEYLWYHLLHHQWSTRPSKSAASDCRSPTWLRDRIRPWPLQGCAWGSAFRWFSFDGSGGVKSTTDAQLLFSKGSSSWCDWIKRISFKPDGRRVITEHYNQGLLLFFLLKFDCPRMRLGGRERAVAVQIPMISPCHVIRRALQLNISQ